LFYGGGLTQFWSQLIAAVTVMVYSFVVAGIIALVIHKTVGMRIPEEDEVGGIDLTTHAETAYELAESGSGGKFAGIGQAAAKREEVTV
jgi:Amt family ammonium transporter